MPVLADPSAPTAKRKAFFGDLHAPNTHSMATLWNVDHAV